MNVMNTAWVISLRLIACLVLTLSVAACSSDNETTTTPDYDANIPQTGQTNSIRAGDDGDWQAGMTWPEPRFFVNADGTVTDKLTGLTWLRNLTCFPEPMSWENAIDAVNSLHDNAMGECGLSDGSQAGDWRLPNVRELFSLSFHEDRDAEIDLLMFYGRQSSYWSSTTFAGDPLDAWFVAYGFVRHGGKAGQFHVWPVRGGLTTDNNEPNNDSIITLQKTGQQTSYRTGDDGDWQAGVDWPATRFIDNTDGTSTDALTGLIWLVNPECNIGGSRWEEAIDTSNALAADGVHQCNLTDGSRAGQWRMPNVLELLSVIDYGQASPALPMSHPFLSVEPLRSVWTSTTLSSDAAYEIDLSNGQVIEGDGFDLRFRVTPVRGGMI